MAKVIPFKNLKPGMTVYEDWIDGKSCLKTEVLNDVGEGWLRMRVHGQFAGTFVISMHEIPTYRYWDELPTDEERQSIDWPSNI